MTDQLDLLAHKVQASSIEALEEIKPKLNGRRLEIYELLKIYGQPMTNNEIAERLDWRINTVTPRVNELVKMFIVKKGERRYCTVIESKVKVNTWCLVNQYAT